MADHTDMKMDMGDVRRDIAARRYTDTQRRTAPVLVMQKENQTRLLINKVPCLRR